MQEVLAQLYRYLWGVWRYRWLALALSWLVAVAGWLMVWQLPESYLATARIDVNSSSILRPLLRGLAIQPDMQQRVNLMSRTLLSRPNLEKLMRMADLDLQVKSDLDEERLLTDLKSSISLSGQRQSSSLYALSAKHRDRDVAKRIVESLITIFIESTLGEKRKDSSGAQAFLDQQVADYELRLSEAEGRMANFKQRHVGVLPGESGGYYRSLQAARKQLSGAKLQFEEQVNRRDEVKRQLAGEEPVFLSSSLSGLSASPIDQRIQALQEQLDRLTVSYTDLHPKVVQIKFVIEDLEAEKTAEIDRMLEEQPEAFAGLQSSPVYQQMRSMLAQTEASVAELRVRVQEYQLRVKNHEKIVNRIPEIEAESQQLDRDYQVISQQHQALLKRRESAFLSDKVEKNANDIKFRVIDPAFVPLKPTEPNKLLLNSVVLLLAVGVGVGVALLMSLLRPIIFDKNTLAEITNLPVLGSVMIITSAQHQRRELIQICGFGVLAVLLLGGFVGVNFSQDLLPV